MALRVEKWTFTILEKDFLGDVIAGGQASGEGSCASFAAEFARYFKRQNIYLIITRLTSRV